MRRDAHSTLQPLQDLLICGQCGRVNHFAAGDSGPTALRCSGCAAVLRAEPAQRLSIHCPACGESLDISASWLGQAVVCARCSVEFVVEKERSAPPASTRPSAAGAALDSVEPALPRLLGEPDADDSGEEDPEDGVFGADEGGGESAGTDGMQRRVRRIRRKKRRKKRSWKEIATFILALVVTVAVMVSGYVIVKRQASAPVVQAPDPAAAAAPAEAGEKEQVIQLDAAEYTKLNLVITGFLSASTPEEVLGLARFPGQVGARLRRYYEERGFLPQETTNVTLIAKEPHEGRLFLRYEILGKDGAIRPLVVERLGPGQFLVDWDSHVRYASTTWDLFVARRGTQPERFQAFLKRDFVGNSHYPIESFNCYFVYWKEEADGVPLFVKRDSPEDHAMLEATEPMRALSATEPSKPSSGSYPVTLEVFFNKEANGAGEPPALELSRFLHAGWVDTSSGQ